MIKDLINRLRHLHYLDPLMNEAADALDRLTGGDVDLPEPQGKIGYEAGRWEYEWISSEDGYTESQLRDYGDRCAAAMVREPLTDEQIMAIGKELGLKCRLGGNPNIDFDYARAIEAAHGINKG